MTYPTYRENKPLDPTPWALLQPPVSKSTDTLTRVPLRSSTPEQSMSRTGRNTSTTPVHKTIVPTKSRLQSSKHSHVRYTC